MTEITMTAEQARTATKDAAIMIIRHAVDAAIKKGENEAEVPAKIMSDDIRHQLIEMGYSISSSTYSNRARVSVIRW